MDAPPTAGSAAAAAPGGQPTAVVARVVWRAWCWSALLEAFLFFRPTPYGAWYVENWWRYFFPALVYNLYGFALLAVPAFALYAAGGRSGLPPPARFAARALLLAPPALLLALDQVDNELMRFMGVHLSPTVLRTFVHPHDSLNLVLSSLLADRGGPLLPFVLLVAAPLGFLWHCRLRRLADAARLRRWPSSAPASAALALALLGLLAVAYGEIGGTFGRLRVQPAVFTLWGDWRSGLRLGERPPELDRLVASWQSARTRPPENRRFTRPGFPLVHAPGEARQAPPGGVGPWNFILVQFESFRGRDAGFLNPELRPSPTPFLDSLAAGPDAAVWSRTLSFGMPTINGILAMHCSLSPHSRLHPLSTFPQLRLLALPELLRAHGWRAEIFSGSDPDWDGQRPWLTRWYDRLWFDKWALGDDRKIVRGAIPRLRELGASGRPFLATLITISNHFPFDSPESRFATPGERPAGRFTHDSVRFTDDVLRELVDSIRAEPWFARTILVVTGDHGYNLGEHDRQPGQRNGYDESLRVPLLIAGPHPALPRGVHAEPSSLLDLAPTLLALAGIDAETPWQGRNLLLPADPERAVTGAVEGVRFAAQGGRFAVLNGAGRTPEWFDWPSDPGQGTDLAAADPGPAAGLVRLAEERRALTDYLIETNRVWPEASPPGGSAASAAAADGAP